MDIKSELILRAISAFNVNSTSEFTYKMLKPVASNESIRLELRKLEQDNIIENLGLNGFAFRFKLNLILECPSFIFDERLGYIAKQNILQIYNNPQEYYTKSDLARIWNCGDSTVYSRKDRLKQAVNMELNEYISNITIITKTFNSKYEVIDTLGGKQFKTNTTDYKCKICGESDPIKFGVRHSICKKCRKEREQEKNKNLSIAQQLYKHGLKSKTGKKTKEKFALTVEEIESILQKQNYKCYYTGFDFSKIKYTETSKLDKPTLDRIDSSKGYTLDNCVICTWWSNSSKAEISKEDFIKLCKQVANNFLDN